MIHTFTIKLNTPDTITEQQIINKFCKGKGFSINIDPDETKTQFFKRLTTEFILDGYKSGLKIEKNEIANDEIAVELQGITTE